IAALPASKKMNLDQMAAYSRQLLDPISLRAASSQNPLARYEYYQSEWKACVFKRTDPESEIMWLKKSLELIRSNRSACDPHREQVIELLIAHQLATKCGKAEEGLKIYRKFYSGQTPETSRGALFLSRFSHIAF